MDHTRKEMERATMQKGQLKVIGTDIPTLDLIYFTHGVSLSISWDSYDRTSQSNG